MKASVIGLGYVGAVTSVCLARDGHSISGVDLDTTKVNLLRKGETPIIEEHISEITKEAVNSGRFQAGSTITLDVVNSDIMLICVGTPSARNGSQDLSAVKRVSEQIGKVLKITTATPVIVIRSTVPPGTTRGIIKPLIEKHSGKCEGKGFHLCFQPEFLREGSSVEDFYNPPFTIVGGSELSSQRVKALFSEINSDFITTDIRTAELLKVTCNTFHALKVCFANEIGRLSSALNIDARTVMKLVCKDTQLNISSAYLKPGFAFGGSCLPKDLRALLYMAKTEDVDLPLLRGILPSNDQHIDQAANLVIDKGNRQIGLIGLSFKQGTDDLRESPLVVLAEKLIGKGYQLKIFDPAVSLAMLLGSNKKYIENSIPHIGNLLTDNLDDVLEGSRTVVVGHQSNDILSALNSHRNGIDRLIDLVGIDPGGWKDYKSVSW